jgi:phage-related protein
MVSIKRVPAVFFRTETGREPVREFLKTQSREDRAIIGRDIAKVELGWPIGMPTSRPLGGGLHEVRSTLKGNRISRVLFYVSADRHMVLLHAFVKKTRKTPVDDLDLAQRRMTADASATRGTADST